MWNFNKKKKEELMDEYRASELFDTNKIFEGIEDEIDNVIKEQKL